MGRWIAAKYLRPKTNLKSCAMTLSKILRTLLLASTPVVVLTTAWAQAPSFTPPVKHAHLLPTQGSNVLGTVVLTKVANGLAVHAHMVNLLPMQQHGFHIHAKGNCKSPDGSSAAGHYNPDCNAQAQAMRNTMQVT